MYNQHIQFFIQHHYIESSNGCLTLSNCKRCRIDQEQQDVVEKALKHRSVGMIIVREVLAGQTDSTDEQRQDLTQCQRKNELPANGPDRESV